MVGLPAELDDLVVNTSQSIGGRFTYNRDWNAGSSIGLGMLRSTCSIDDCVKISWSTGHTQCSIERGMRSSSAVAYLDPLTSSGSRPNLSILINTVVTKILQSNVSIHVPEFKKVELAQRGSGKYYHGLVCLA